MKSFLFFSFFMATAYAQTCPEGFVSVPANEAYQVTKPFCVMKYEARAQKVSDNQISLTGCKEEACTTENWASIYNEQTNKAGYRPVSVAQGIAWRHIGQDAAMSACRSLGPQYSLISNEEWMTIAENIAKDDRNWSGGKVAQGFLSRGHSDGSPESPCDSTVENVETDCKTKGQTFDQKRTHTLSNNQVIWDFAGNLYNWTTWRVQSDQKAYSTRDKKTVEAWREFTEVDMKVGKNDFMAASKWMPSNHPSYDSVHNIGRYWSGEATGVTAAIRGGRYGNREGAGIYMLDLSSAPTISSRNIAFRCVYKN